MNLFIYVNETYEEEKALYDKSSKKIILKGDYYHDKIDHLIEGYLQALKDFKIYTEEVETWYIKPAHEMFDKLGFYDDSFVYQEDEDE